ncbi:cytochrome P450 [Sorangium sp. So ce542]|uniref:cytochrome P450 n=1 Tax=Sorangium sp. So ce542 TaxID=3133316 RepID=UPI003F5EEE7A
MTGDVLTAHRRGEIEEAATTLVTPAAYAEPRRVEDARRLLREHQPFCRIDHPRFERFYAVTRHAHVAEISRRHRDFINAPRTLLLPREADEQRRAGRAVVRPLVEMDGALHDAHRALLAPYITGHGLGRLQQIVAELARQAVDRMAELGGECDVVAEVASPYPLKVLAAVLGEAPSSYTRLASFVTGSFEATIGDMVRYLAALLADRRSRRGDDVVSGVAHGLIDGEPLAVAQQISHLLTLITAGYETTMGTLAGGVAALVEHPAEWRRLRDDPSLLDSAVEEMVRWASPIQGFMRTAADGCEVDGHRFEAGDAVLLSYPSANRDASVFSDPHRFDVGRAPNRHLGFGVGVHYCLGAGLARLELRCFFGELLARLRSATVVGVPTYSCSLFTGGLTSLRLRYELVGRSGERSGAATTLPPRA